VQRIVKAYERHSELTGAGRQMALRLNQDTVAEPAVDLASNPKLEMSGFPPVA
jgi:hypothetical protein